MTPAARIASYVGLSALSVVVVAAATVAAISNPVLVFGGMIAVVLVLATALRPTVGIVAWLAVLVLIPDWTRLPLGLKPISAIGAVVIVGLLLSRRRQRTAFAWADFALVGAVILLALLTFLDNYPLVLLSNLAAVLALSYWVGRGAPSTARRVFLYAMLVVSVWGILEAVSGVHLFSDWMLSSTHKWGEVQTRSGVDRSEAAFGHAIAYGATIAMAIPFARELPKHAWIAQAVLLAGVIASFSRGPIITAALTLGLATIFLRKGRPKLVDILGLIVGVVAIALVFEFLYGAEDSATTALSGDQRTIQLLTTLPSVQWFGSAGLSLEDGRIQTVGANIIDNTFLRLGINFGWIIAALILAPLLFAVVRFFRAEVTPSSVALIGQIPVLFVTTLILQWQAAVFLIAGMAVTELVALRANRSKKTAAAEPAYANNPG